MTSLQLVLLLMFAQDIFTRFSFCRENARGPYETQCVNLTPQGTGEVQLKARGSSEHKENLVLSAPARSRFLSLLGATNLLADAANYESKRKVADLGLKRLVLDMPSGRREAVFNFSTMKEVVELTTFFDSLISQETFIADVETALQFDRLSIPKRLDQLENELKANRIVDPERLMPVLEKIEGDPRLLNFARTRAGKLRQQLIATGAAK